MNKLFLIKGATIISTVASKADDAVSMLSKGKQHAGAAAEKIKGFVGKNKGKTGLAVGAGVTGTAQEMRMNSKEKQYQKNTENLFNAAKNRIQTEKGRATEAESKVKKMKDRGIIDRVLNKDV